MLWEVISLSIQSFGFLLSKSLQSLLSHFSHVRLCATPQTAAHQAPPSLGFSRQERWRGLPFPSPIHESILIFGKSNTVKFKNKIKLKKKKKKKSESEIAQSCPTLSDPIAAFQAPLSMGFSRQEY